MSIIQYKDYDRLLLAVDCIIFGFDGQRIKSLLIQRGFEPGLGQWSLMGGFVNSDESVDDAAKRVLRQLTGLDNIYMEQLHCYSDPGRDPGGRVVSVAYFALISIDNYNNQLLKDHQAEWFSFDNFPPLIFDHQKMVMDAKDRLQQKVANHPIGFALLPPKFTLPQLQCLYEAIYESPVDKRNFTRKILSLDILEKLDEKEKTTSKKGAFLYVFDQQKYMKLENEGLKFI
ncbi:MAG TPA: NUDIX domain-containing protein [Flavitalea sp.]|nr:NUDIX domain-containing protein [Flavitalea sp.]